MLISTCSKVQSFGGLRANLALHNCSKPPQMDHPSRQQPGVSTTKCGDRYLSPTPLANTNYPSCWVRRIKLKSICGRLNIPLRTSLVGLENGMQIPKSGSKSDYLPYVVVPSRKP